MDFKELLTRDVFFSSPEAETLAYLDGKGPKPPRFARVTMVTNSSVLEFKAGFTHGVARKIGDI